MGCGVCSRLERQTNLTPPYCCKKSKRRLVSSNLQMSVSEICCKKFFVFKSRLRRKRLKKNAFKYRYNSALIRFLIFPPVGQIFPPVGKKLLVVGKLLSYVKVLIYLWHYNLDNVMTYSPRINAGVSSINKSSLLL